MKSEKNLDSKTFVFDPGIHKTHQRLDSFLSCYLSDLSRSYINILIREGRVSIDNLIQTKPSTILQKICSLSIILPDTKKTHSVSATVFPYRIVYEDTSTIVIDKPAGVNVQNIQSHNELTQSVEQYLVPMHGFIADADHRHGIVHRLDKDTTGLLLLAKTNDAFDYYTKIFHDRKISKEYICIVKGEFPHGHSIIDAPIARNTLNRTKMGISEEGRQAKTEVTLLDHNKEASYLKIKLHTGRTHQIRVHLSSLGFPVLGDTKYGNKNSYPKRQMLHAYKLTFLPFGVKKEMNMISKIPSDFEKVMKEYNLSFHL